MGKTLRHLGSGSFGVVWKTAEDSRGIWRRVFLAGYELDVDVSNDYMLYSFFNLEF